MLPDQPEMSIELPDAEKLERKFQKSTLYKLT